MAQRSPSRAVRRLATHSWTRADLARLPDDGNRYEVLDGVLLVTPQAAFTHQRIATRLAARLTQYCDEHGAGVVVAPGAVPHGDSELQPDVQVIPGTPAPHADWTDLPRPILVVEVLSDSTARRDLGIKRDAYLRWEIAEYWVVDVSAAVVHVFTPGEPAGRVVRDEVVWTPDGATAPLVVDLPALFGTG